MAALGFTFDPSAIADEQEAFAGLPDIPAIRALAEHRQWVAWRREMRDGRPTKIPVNPRHGGNASSTSAATWGTLEQATERARAAGLPGVGFVLTAADDFTGIDIDKVIDANGDMEPWAAEIVALGETYCEISPSGHGLRLIARGKVAASTKSNAAGIEIYRDKRYLTITGDHIPNAPLDIHPAPKTLAALMARIQAAKPAEEITPSPLTGRDNLHVNPRSEITPSGSGSDFFRRVNDAALGQLGTWVPVLFPMARFQPGTGAWRVSSKALGRSLQEDLSLAPNGIVDFGVHDMGDANGGKRTPIDIALDHGPAASAVDAALWLCDVLHIDPEALGWEDRDAIAADGAEIAGRLIAHTEAGDRFDPETGELVDDPPPVPKTDPAGDFPDGLAHPPGLVGEIAEWVFMTARRPSRIMALGCALTLVGTAMGRHWGGPTRSGSHLYVLTLAPTGAGKDHMLKQANRVLAASAMSHLIGPDEFISMPAVVNFLLRAPLSLCAMDEFGAFLKRVNGRRASGFEQSITKTLRSVWGSSFNLMRTPEWAGRQAETIHAPAMSILGVSTPEEFFAALEGNDVVNGLLNRFLLLPTDERPKDREPILSPADVPARLVEGMQARLYGGNPMRMNTSASSEEIDPVIVPWADDRAKGVYEAMVAEIEAMGDARPDTQPFFVRTAEMAVRIATILAVGQNSLKPAVTAEDMAWGRDLAMWSARKMLDMAGLYMAETETQADANRILRTIRDAGGRISRQDMLRRLQHRMKARDLKDVLESLVESGAITAEKVPGKGRTGIWYTAT